MFDVVINTVPPERLASCTCCKRLVLAYTLGPDRPSFSFDPTGLDRSSIRDHLGLSQCKQQGFGSGQGELHACHPSGRKGAPR